MGQEEELIGKWNTTWVYFGKGGGEDQKWRDDLVMLKYIRTKTKM